MNYRKVETFIFPFFSLLFVAAGLHHLYEYFIPELRPDYPPLRHIVFLALNLVLAYFMVNRSKYFLPFLFLISAQQLYGHGGNIMQNWSSDKPILYTDWAVVLVIPMLLLIYSYDVLRGNKTN